jgi:prolyl-tRNA synthetase
MTSLAPPRVLKQISKPEQLYQILSENKIEALYDDREETPGVKVKDTDLSGIPTLPLCYPLG